MLVGITVWTRNRVTECERIASTVKKYLITQVINHIPIREPYGLIYQCTKIVSAGRANQRCGPFESVVPKKFVVNTLLDLNRVLGA